MKNVQVIDGAVNSTYDIFQIPDKIFRIIFPKGSDVAFLDEAEKRLRRMGFDYTIWNKIYANQVDKKHVISIHGTLHLTGSPASKRYFPQRKECEVVRNRKA